MVWDGQCGTGRGRAVQCRRGGALDEGRKRHDRGKAVRAGRGGAKCARAGRGGGGAIMEEAEQHGVGPFAAD